MSEPKTKKSKLGRAYKLDGKQGGYRGGGRTKLFKHGKRFATIIPKNVYDYAMKTCNGTQNRRIVLQKLVEDSRKLEIVSRECNVNEVLASYGYKPLT